MSLKIKAAVLTHVGNVRTNNEDNFFLNKRIRRCVSRKKASCRFSGQDKAILFAVADGMGGHAHGELASLHAVQSLQSCSFAQITSVATACLRWANEQICEEIEKSGNRMGSTLTALYIDEGKACAATLATAGAISCAAELSHSFPGTTARHDAWWIWAFSHRSKRRVIPAATN